LTDNSEKSLEKGMALIKNSLERTAKKKVPAEKSLFNRTFHSFVINYGPHSNST
jgi:hypothetical protein